MQVVLAPAVLLAVSPAPHVLTAIGPVEGAGAVLFVVLILAFVFAAISPLNFAEAVHLVVLPVPLVLPVLAPDVLACVMTKLPFPWI